MSSKDRDDVWDFTSVIDLIHSLSSKAEKCTASDTSLGFSSEEPITPDQDIDDDKGRSELGNFDRLWKYLGQPLDVAPPIVNLEPSDASSEFPGGEAELAYASVDSSVSKGVRWRDEVEGADLADNDENYDPNSLPKLSKARKKKLRRKKKTQAMRARARFSPSLALTSSENEFETEEQDTTPIRDRGSIIREILGGSRPETKNADLNTSLTEKAADQDTEAPKWPIANPRYFLRSSVRKQETPSQNPEASITEIAARKSKLLQKMRDQFILERPYLENISVVSIAGSLADSGVHVFVDASNIMIGFHNSLKLSRGLSVNARIHRQPLSFYNLSLILERGRPAAKRVLVGSDNFPAIQEAKTIGYETNILDRVHKAKELTPRQKRFSNSGNGGASSGSETTAVMYAPEKWVEQAVDEILHLKILESVVDAKAPSVIVLATGDAAEAEYSEGFLKMVERAMAKGWKVELCSFRKNISGAYRRKDFRSRWSSQFKIIEMDDFVEELLGME